MKYLRVQSAPTPPSSRLLERRGERYTLGGEGRVLAVPGGVLYTHNNLPVIVPDPLPAEQIAAEYIPGR